jgi:hypothetical protein
LDVRVFRSLFILLEVLSHIVQTSAKVYSRGGHDLKVQDFSIIIEQEGAVVQDLVEYFTPTSR